MASKRDIKKSINDLTFELVSECYTFMYFHPDKNHEKTDEITEKILDERNSLINKVNNPIDTADFKKNRAHFRKIRKRMSEMVTLMDGLSE